MLCLPVLRLMRPGIGTALVAEPDREKDVAGGKKSSVSAKDCFLPVNEGKSKVNEGPLALCDTPEDKKLHGLFIFILLSPNAVYPAHAGHVPAHRGQGCSGAAGDMELLLHPPNVQARLPPSVE